jgi:molybdopterin molybdotransferase
MNLEHPHHHVQADMLSVEDALTRILSYFSILEPEEKPILDAVEQTLAEDIVAPFDIPPLDNSAMDGFAVRKEDIEEATPTKPRILRVIGQLAAGSLPTGEVTKGTAVRIMTGAPIPPGADTVVPFEETDEVARKASGQSLTEIAVLADAKLGAYVRLAGEDISKHQRVLEAGTIVRSAEAGILASLGRSKVQVIRRPTVAILATGDELLTPGEPAREGKIYDSNSFSAAAAVLRYGGIPRLLGIAADNLEALKRKLTSALDADLLVTSAGVSQGDYDVVKEALATMGEIDFWSVRMRPAKPLAFGTLLAQGGRLVPHIGLPGNPVSALVAFEQFCRPVLLKMLGRRVLAKPTIEATLSEPIYNNDGRRVYARAVISRRNGHLFAALTGSQESNVLTSMSKANGLAICPENIAQMNTGQKVQVQMLDWPEEVTV